MIYKKGGGTLEKLMQHFERFCAWSYDNGIFYFSGRDIYCILIGVLISIITILLVWSLIGKDE